jgi:hypothetical protein
MWEDKIKIDLRETGFDGGNGLGWPRIGSNGGFVNMVMALRVP